MTIKDVNSWEDLVRFLRSWNQWGDTGDHDLNGGLHLLLAITQNLADAADGKEDEIEEARALLRPEDRLFLISLARG